MDDHVSHVVHSTLKNFVYKKKLRKYERESTTNEGLSSKEFEKNPDPDCLENSTLKLYRLFQSHREIKLNKDVQKRLLAGFELKNSKIRAKLEEAKRLLYEKVENS